MWKNKNWFFLLFVLLIAFFLRFYQLGSIPAGFLNDEANTGYDAYSLLLTGKDQWGTFFPINNFIGFGDFQPPINRYTTVISIFLFGLNEFSVRFISALSGFLSVIVLYFLTKKLFNKWIGLLSALFLSIMPWAIGLNRIGHEANIAIFLLLCSLFFGILPKLNRYLYYSVFFLALSMYTYSAYILYAPIVLLVIFFLNYKNKKGLKFLVKPLILFLIIISPIIFQKNAASVRFSQVGITHNINSIGLVNVLNDKRWQCQKEFSPFICKIIDNKPVLFANTFIKNYLSHFSTNFLYTSGTETQISILPRRGLDNFFNFIFLILGIIYIIKFNKNKRINYFLIFLFLFSPVPDSFTSDGNFIRSSMMIPFLALFNGIGFFYLIELFRINKKINFYLLIFVLFCFFCSTFSFFITYTTYFKNNYSIFSQYGYKELMQKTHVLKNNYQKIYISRHLNDAKQYIYYLFYNKYDPEKYQSKKDVSYSYEGNGWVSIDSLENIYFVSQIPLIEEESNLAKEKVLLISHPKDFPEIIKTEFVIKDKLGDVIFKAVNLSDLLKYKREHKKEFINETF